MKKILKYGIIAFIIFGGLFAIQFFIKSNSKSIFQFKTQVAKTTSIEKETVATGKVIPEDEVKIKPQVSGIVDKILVEEGDSVDVGDLLAQIKVVPNEESLNRAKGTLLNAKITLENAQIDFERNKRLLEKKVISEKEMQDIELRYKTAEQNYSNEKSNFQIVKIGSVGGAASANTNIRATISGTVLEIPVKEGYQVIESNTFNDGTTVAVLADLNKMIFEGKIDESEVDKLVIGMPLSIELGAIKNKKFKGELRFVAPKGIEEQGTVKFKIKGDVILDDDLVVRAGYSANASLVLDKRKNVLAISESLLQYDKETEDPYVEVEIGEQKFERRDVKLGISDGVNVEILSGITKKNKIKVWNKTEVEREEEK